MPASFSTVVASQAKQEANALDLYTTSKEARIAALLKRSRTPGPILIAKRQPKESQKQGRGWRDAAAAGAGEASRVLFFGELGLELRV